MSSFANNGFNAYYTGRGSLTQFLHHHLVSPSDGRVDLGGSCAW